MKGSRFLMILMSAVAIWTTGCKGGTSQSRTPSPTDRAASVVARPPAVAGQFYPARPAELDALVDRLLRTARKTGAPGRPVAVVAPHAGYVYSGPCAAAAYAALGTNRYERVIVLGPSHHVGFAGISLPDPRYGAYRTPLGDVPIDRAVCEALSRQPGFVRAPGAEAPEHSVEVELPFLQKTVGTFKLVPLLCGMLDDGEIPSLAKALLPFLDANALLVASSDFTHYGPNYGFMPFETDVPAHLHAWLKTSSECVAALDLDGFLRHCRETHDTICGERGIAVMMSALLQQGRHPRGEVLDTTTSGDVTGEFANSVSYAAIGFFARTPMAAGGDDAAPQTGAKPQKEDAAVKATKDSDGKQAFSIGKEAQAKLLQIARQSIEGYLKDRKERGFEVTEPELLTPAAVFVTLTQNGQLRGCIGTTAPHDPLYKAVAGLAVAAAVEDNRFEPLSLAELERTHIEISVLSPLRRVKDAGEIRQGEDGVVVRRGWHSGLFLPQVWADFTTKEGFLDELCRQKAHLAPSAWKDPSTELYVFTVFAFEDKK